MRRHAATMPKRKNLNFLYHESASYGWQIPKYRSAAIARQEYVEPAGWRYLITLQHATLFLCTFSNE